MTYFEGKNELVEAALGAIQRAKPDIVALGAEIFEDPEPAFAEKRAAQRITDVLASSGYEIERNLGGLPTAFRATYQRFDSEAMRKGLRHGHIAILAEYDADDERGHTAGRHLVAAAAVGSAVGLAAALTGVYGRVSIVGCPAASTHEGKRILTEADVFEPEDAALGARPASSGSGFQPTINSTGETLATARMRVRFSGPGGESEARQRFATEAGAVADDEPNSSRIDVVLAGQGVVLDLRARTNPDLEALIARLREVAESCATSTGSTFETETLDRIPAFNVNRLLARRVKTFGDNIGLKQDRIVKTEPSTVSDWAYVSLVTSTLQASYPVSGHEVEAGTDAFAQASASAYAYNQMLAAAGAVALTGLDLLGDMEFRGFADGELIRTLKAQGVSRTPRRWLGVHPVKPRDDSNGHSPVTGNPSSRKGRS